MPYCNWYLQPPNFGLFRLSKIRNNKINAKVNFTLPRSTPTRNYALAALLFLKTITTNADTIRRWAILNSGATGHFLTTSAPATNILPTAMPIRVHSIHTCTLDIPLLPPGARAAHIIPGLALHLLLCVVTMCNAGCTITFSKIGCTIVYHGRMIICGHMCTHTGLQMIPLAENTTPPTTMPTTSPNPIKLAMNIDSLASEYAQYVHQLLCSPPAATLLLALDKSTKLQTTPGLMPALICAHLPQSTATDKGHMHCHRSNTASTRNKHAVVIFAHAEVDCMFPAYKACAAEDMFCLPLL
jgi:hypothetical protein